MSAITPAECRTAAKVLRHLYSRFLARRNEKPWWRRMFEDDYTLMIHQASLLETLADGLEKEETK